ncbi:MAG: magnesium transporter CorA [Thermoplasmata archaeon]|nr:magnesium transporter CorA [Thermoplasmata archaeon]MBE3136467.1 magnesium transporter CorA [Thermoplasmata archaeon]MBE3141532.1 magnesium transporter CorA [Thermoplasmata archaeon]
MGEAEKIQKSAFYVSLSKDGVTTKVESDNVSEIVGLLKEDALEWMDFTVENINEDSFFIATSLKFSLQLVASVLSERYSSYEDLDSELGLMLPAVRVERFDVKVYSLLILIRKNLIITIHPKEVVRLAKIYRYADIFMKKIRQDLHWMDKLTILLTRIIDENNQKNFNGLRMIEEEGDELGKFMAMPKAPRTEIGNDIYKMKHALITYLNTLWASWDVINSLRYGDAETITDNPKLLQRIGILGDDINRQIALSEHMSEVLASGLEVLQTIYNNQLQMLNNRLAFIATWLAVLATAGLVPNTLATIFGIGKINDLIDWPWIITILILSTIICTYLMYLLFKKKEWLPPKSEC